MDYVCVDGQHGVVGFDASVPMFAAIRGAGAAPITRVTSNDLGLINKSLDAGAVGVIVPLVNTPEEAARAVAACRYPPEGARSYGPIRASGVIGSKAPADLGEEVLCIAQIETREGLENAEEISATPGLDGVYVGPADLALSLGLDLDSAGEHREHVEAVERIREACWKNGIAVGVHGISGESARQHAEQGYSMVNVGVDYLLLTDAVRREVNAARSRQT